MGTSAYYPIDVETIDILCQSIENNMDKSPPRGVLDLLPECTTIAMTYPGDSNQPTKFVSQLEIIMR